MSLGEWIQSFLSTILHIIKSITIVDVLDILFISVILYFLYKFIRDKRAGRLAIGVAFLIVFLIVSDLVGMRAMQYIFKNILQVGVISLVILFQPEFRSLLEKVGASPIKGIISIGDTRRDDSLMLAVREVSAAAAEMSASKTGALIVFERNTKLGEIISTGTIIDSQTGSFLIRNIFFNKAPLHDGAMIIRDSRVYAAGCLLPLSHQNDINRDLGTRHRAAIGLSENSDAVVVVVSEETGIISVAVNGKLTRGFTGDTLRDKLFQLLVADWHTNQQRAFRISRRKASEPYTNGEERDDSDEG